MIIFTANGSGGVFRRRAKLPPGFPEGSQKQGLSEVRCILKKQPQAGQTSSIFINVALRSRFISRFLAVVPSLADSSESVSGQRPNTSVEQGYVQQARRSYITLVCYSADRLI